MDYDDNDSQSQNPRLAGEGSAKFPSVLRPYALPKFDFDDSLQGHLRFDNLVETEVFLGIESQEDNQWIEDFSRGSSAIEFNSSAAESCSISRHNNVWSEATSSESVEMLLKSVGQEEMIPGQTIIEEPNPCDQLGSSSKQMEPVSEQEVNILSDVQDIIDQGPTLPPDKFLESLPGVNENAGELPQVRDSPQTRESLVFLDPNVVGERHGSSLAEGNQLMDSKVNDANKRLVDSSLDKALDNRIGEDSSATEMRVDDVVSSGQTIVQSIGESYYSDCMVQALHTSDANAGDMPRDNEGGKEDHGLSKLAQIDDPEMHYAVKSDAYRMENPHSAASEMNSVGEQSTVETSVNNMETSSNMMLKGDSDQQMVEGTGACPIVPVHDSNCEVLSLIGDTDNGDISKTKMHDKVPGALEGVSKFEVHAVEVDNTSSGIGANTELKMDSDAQMTSGLGVPENKKDLLQSGGNLDSLILEGDSDASLLSVEENKAFEDQSVVKNISHMGDISRLEVVSSAELLSEAHGNENMEHIPGAMEVSGEGLDGEGRGSPSHLAESKICEANVVTGQGGTSNHDQGEGIIKSEASVCKSQAGTSLGNESGNAVTSFEIIDHKDDRNLTSHVGGFVHLDNNEEDATEISDEASLLISKECSQVAGEVVPVSATNKVASCDISVQLINEAPNQSKASENSNLASQSEPQDAVAGKVGQDLHSNEPEIGPVKCDSIVEEDGGVTAAKHSEEKTLEESCEEASLEVSESAGDTLNANQGSSSPFCASKGDISVSVDPDKSNHGSPIVTERENHNQDEAKGPLDQNVAVSVAGGAAKKPSSQDPKDDDASKNKGSFSCDVTNLDKKGGEKGWQQSTAIQATSISLVVERSPSISGQGQIGSRRVQEISHGAPQASNGEIAVTGSKGTPERKTRRAASRTSGKESAKKGNQVKETTPARPLERVEKSCVLLPGPGVSCQLVQPEGVHHPGHMEQGSKRPSNILATPVTSLPDLNTSVSLPAVYQQPFTDLQQVQLRAQIFVYGSLIQGTSPDEACMIPAFGGLDGGRSIWEKAWRACIERLQGQKSRASNSGTPLQPFSGSRAPDQADKQGALQSKMISSPAGRASSKSTPSPVVNPIIPLSSPLWSISTPSGDVLQSSAIPRSVLMDHNQGSAPLHPYQIPPLRNFVGQNTSWSPQSPFPGPWVASPQAAVFDSGVRFSALPVTEPVKLTPVRESSLPHMSGLKHVSSSPIINSVGPTSVFPGTSTLLDVKKATASPSQHSADPKPRKRKKVPASEDLSHISLPPQSQMDRASASGATGHLSTSVAPATSPTFISKTTTGEFVPAASLTALTNQPKIGDSDVEQRVILSDETLNKVKQAKSHAEDAAALAATAVNHSQVIWSQLDKQKNSGMIPDVEAKLASAAIAIAAAASVAKAAAAAAKVACDAALQAKLMAEEAMVAGSGNSVLNNTIPLSNNVNVLGNATPASILKGQDGTNSSGSVIVAAREAARRRLEAASAASKRAENLDAIVKAAELAAEAVTQAGKVVAMGDPLPLSELVRAGPESYWKVTQVSSEPSMNLKSVIREQSNADGAEDGHNSAQHIKGVTSDREEAHTTSYGKSSSPRELSREPEDDMRLVDGVRGFVTKGEKESRGQKGHKVSDLAKSVGVVSELKSGSRSTSTTVQNEQQMAVETLEGNSIKEGSLVEVFKDGDGFKASWFLASVLSLKDGEAYVCYTEFPSGSGQLKEWVPLKEEGDTAPRIRIPHPMTTLQFEGARKRRRSALGNYAWSVGDKVDAWIRDCWWEGVITEKNKKDETALTVHFPAQGETSIIRAWQLRPSLVWKDGEWMEWSYQRESNRSSHEGDTPQQKRMKLSSPAVEAKGKEKMATNIDVLELGVPEESRSLDLSVNEKIFNIGRNTRAESKPDAFRTTRSGLQKEGPRVIFGVPKPGKKRKFMEVSKHYVADKNTKTSEANESIKFPKVQMPQGSGPRSWKNTKIDSREKRATESKPRVLKPGKQQSVSTRTIPRKDNLLTTVASAPKDAILTDRENDSFSVEENASEKQSRVEFGSFSNPEGVASEGPILFSSLPSQSDESSSRKVLTSNSKSERASKGKLAPAGAKLAKIEEGKVYNGNTGKSVPGVAEPRRSNRKIQPTSRLLEGLQSSLSISKIPVVSHDRGHKTQNRSASSSRGNNHG